MWLALPLQIFPGSILRRGRYGTVVRWDGAPSVDWTDIGRGLDFQEGTSPTDIAWMRKDFVRDCRGGSTDDWEKSCVPRNSKCDLDRTYMYSGAVP